MGKEDFIRQVIDSSMKLGGLHETISSCKLCSLSSSRTKAVPGEGPAHAKIMLIGEAPGAIEDATGKPFVGRAGRLLDQSLDLAGVKRSEVFITSVVKCRPTKNRKPKSIELQSCRPYILSQMDLIRPKVIGLMGNVACKAILNIDGVTTIHGRVFEGIFLVTFHPAAVLRNRRLQGDFVADLKKIHEISIR
jgi:uracil-DNA glycosylase family 4